MTTDELLTLTGAVQHWRWSPGPSGGGHAGGCDATLTTVVDGHAQFVDARTDTPFRVALNRIVSADDVPEPVAPSVPEPLPRREGVEVLPAALGIFARHGWACDLLRERAAFGVAKYGQPLMTDDGRDHAEDARQELGDLLMYASALVEAGEVDAVAALAFDMATASKVLLGVDDG